MAITIQDGFSVRTTVPVDARFVADTVASMNAMEAEVRYEGLTCYVVENGVLYHLKGGILNEHWMPVGEGNVSGPTGPVLGNSVPVFNGTSGKELKSTPVNIDAYGGITGVSEISAASALIGSLRIAEIVNSGSSGENVTLPITYGRVVLTNSSLVSIAEIDTSFMINPMSVEVTLHNRTGDKVILVHDYISATEAILLPNEKDLTIPNEGSVTLVKSSQAGGKFIIKGGAGGGQGSLNSSQLTLLTADDSLTDWDYTSSFEISKVSPIQGGASYLLGLTVDESAVTKVKPVDDAFKSRTLVLKFNYRLTSGVVKAVIFDQDDTKLYGAEFTVPPAVGVGNFVTTFFMPPTVTGYRIGFVSESTVAGQNFQFDNVEITSDVSKIVNISNLPVGSIIASMLTEEQFLSAYGAGWIIADGRDVSGSKYSAVTGNSTVPDLRGVFLRGRNNGRSDGNQNPNGEIPLGTFTGDAIREMTGRFYLASASPSGVFSQTGGALSGAWGSGSSRYAIDFKASTQVPTALDNRPKNVTVNHFIKIDDFNNSIVAPVDQVTERSIAFRWRSPAEATEANLSATGRIGDYVTGQYSAGNNVSQCTSRPDQPDSEMSVNGIRIFTRVADAPSNAGSPARFVIKIAEPGQMSSCSYSGYADGTKLIQLVLESVKNTTTTFSGLWIREFNPVTGLLTLDAGLASTGMTARALYSTSGVYYTNGYICFTASKLAQAVAIPVPARYVVKTYISGRSWYVIHNDGWVIQGGLLDKGAVNANNASFSFLITMRDVLYNTTNAHRYAAAANVGHPVAYSFSVSAVAFGTDNNNWRMMEVRIEGYGDSLIVKSHGANPNY